MKMEFKNFIFDVDGTLVDSYEASLKTLDRSIKEVTEIELSETDLVQHFGIPSENFFKLFKLPNETEIMKKWDKYYFEYEKKLFPSTLEILQTLTVDDNILALVTSRNKKEIDELKIFDILHFFKQIVGSEDTVNHKPHKEPIEKVINNLNLNKDETIYIGDSIYDSQAAKNAGIKFALASWGAIDKTIPADIVLESLNDLLEYIKK